MEQRQVRFDSSGTLRHAIVREWKRVASAGVVRRVGSSTFAISKILQQASKSTQSTTCRITQMFWVESGCNREHAFPIETAIGTEDIGMGIES